MPKSSTAVVAQQADTRLMSWSTRIDERAGLARGSAWITSAEVLGLLVGQPGGRLVEQHQPGLPDDGPGHLDEPPLARRRAPPTARRAALRGRRTSTASMHVARGATRGRRAGVLVDEAHVVEHRQLGDRLLGLERPAQPPARPPEVGHRQQVVAERRDGPAGRPDEPAEHVEERRLAGAVRPDQPARAARRSVSVMPSIGMTPPKRTVRSVDLDHGVTFAAPTLRRETARRAARPSLRQVLGHLLGEPAGRGQQHLQHADTEQDREQLGRHAPVVEQRRAGAAAEAPATTAPQRL